MMVLGILGFLAMGAVGGGLALRGGAIVNAMAAALLAADPQLDVRFRRRWHTNIEGMRITAEYERRFPGGPLTARLRRIYWALGVWLMLGVICFYALQDRLPG
ncbi:hypothetical protein DDF62_07745 [Caulobacter radicis]|uniref:hypothetical protein n=1 Tax=Caulobacter radicis TaxID=2172650 RepID=UPI000D579780|nr:hypothetical protein [Caulobacter radicis]PVM91252.1 hypothetical protein DDF62_07745 [Caulobacter radicis]